MSIPFRISFLFVPVLLATALSGCSADAGSDDVGQTDQDITDGPIIVHHFGAPGPSVNKWGYDIKQPGKAAQLSAADADEIFNQIGMNLLRIPVYAKDAHPSAGTVTESAYSDVLTAVGTVKSKNAGVDVFASLRLEGKDSFPGWVLSGGVVDAEKYSTLIEDYLAFMKGKGVTVDWLGVDNEDFNNGGDITPVKYDTIASNVRQWCNNHGVKVPGFIAPEDFSPALDTAWLQDLWQRPSQFDNVDRIGVHIYSRHRDGDYVNSIQTLAANRHDKGLWDSEIHWNDTDSADVQFDDIKLGMLTTFDHVDNGFSAISWWSFQPRSTGTKAGFIETKVVETTMGAGSLDTDDRDGVGLGESKFNTRAFRNGPNTVTLWVANYTNDDRTGQRAEIENHKIASSSYVQWTSAADPNGKSGNAKVLADSSAFKMTYPSNTITCVTVTLQ